MIQIKKTILTLVALLAVTTGAWATPNSIVINGTPQVGDKSISLTYHFDPENVPGITSYVPSLKVKCAADNKWDETFLSFFDVSSGTTTISLAELGEFEAGKTYEVCFAYYNGSWVDDVFQSFVPASASSGTAVDIDWNAETKTGTFTQPAGNVTVSVEYYDLATLASQGLTAAEDAAAKTEAPLAVVADGAVTGGTLMYYVATDENFSQADAIALAETEWNAAIPTAETIDAAGGTYYVWYYIKGDAEHSDTDPQRLAVTVLPEPTYTVEFAEGTPESDKWTASPNTGVKKGQTVTVTYTGERKVIGVKAEKMAPGLIVNPAVGQVIGDDGKNYADAAAATSAGATAVAKIVYVGRDNGEAAPYNHGLALALSDASCKWKTSQTDAGHTKQTSSTFTEESGLQYNDATHNSDTYPAFKAAIANNGTAAPTGCSSWFLASGYQWNKIIGAAGLSNLGLQSGTYYWSSTEYNAGLAWGFDSNSGNWIYGYKDNDINVRACIAF